MCGRYSFAPKPKQLDAQLRDVQRPNDLKISFNVAPTHGAYVILNEQPDKLQMLEWGLVPRWSADGKNNGRLINARAEGIEEKPSFREPIRSHRCLVPADSFYEWRTEPGGRKIPYRIFLQSGDLMFMAGIWEVWQQGDTFKRTFSIITTAPNQEMSTLHNRMPLILQSDAEQQSWLSPLSLSTILGLLRPFPDGTLSMYRVSEKLNKPNYDAANLHEVEQEQPTLF